MSKAEHAIILGAAIDRARKKLRAMENELAALLGEAPKKVRGPHPTGVRGEILKALPTEPFKLQELRDRLTYLNPGTVQMALNRMVKEGEVMRIEPGVFLAKIAEANG